MYSMISRLMMLRTAPRGDPDEFFSESPTIEPVETPRLLVISHLFMVDYFLFIRKLFD